MTTKPTKDKSLDQRVSPGKSKFDRLYGNSVGLESDSDWFRLANSNARVKAERWRVILPSGLILTNRYCGPVPAWVAKTDFLNDSHVIAAKMAYAQPEH